METSEISLADIRDPGSFSASNIENAIHVSNDNLEDFLSKADINKPLVVYCYHGNSSKGAAEFFLSKGYKEVYSMDGGFELWRGKFPIAGS